MKHIAGTTVELNKDHVIQRCIVCGFALVDKRYSETAVPEGDESDPIPDFEYGSVVEVYGNGTPTMYRKTGQMVDPNYDLTDEDKENLDGFDIYTTVNDIDQLCRRD